jgi:hypothetical protein
MDIKTLMKTTLISATLVSSVAGGYIFLSPNTKEKYCKIDLVDVNQENMIQKMIEEIEKREVTEKEVEIGCDFETVVDEKNKIKVYKVKDTNCKKQLKEDYIKLKNENFNKVLNLDKHNPDEAKEIMAEFTDIWNYNLFRSCGLKNIIN